MEFFKNIIKYLILLFCLFIFPSCQSGETLLIETLPSPQRTTSVPTATPTLIAPEVTRPSPTTSTQVITSTSVVSPVPTETSTPLATKLWATNLPSFLDATQFDSDQPSKAVILVAYKNADAWGLAAIPNNFAFASDTFDRFYGPTVSLQNLSKHIDTFSPVQSPNKRLLLLPGDGGLADSDGDAGTGLWLIDLLNENGERILPQASAPSWSPDGTQIAYVSDDSLYLLAVDDNYSSEPIFSRDNLSILFAHWSPNGKFIATLSSNPDARKLEHWLVPTTGGEPIQISNLPVGLYELSPDMLSWSFDSRYLLIQHQGKIYDVENDRLIDFPSNGMSVWIPESHNLLVNNIDGLSIVTIGGETLWNISSDFASAFAVSDTTKRLAFSVPAESGNENIFIADLNAFEVNLINEFTLPVKSQIRVLQWGPNGEELFIDDFEAHTPIWFVSIEKVNNKPIQLTERGVLVGIYSLP